MELDKNEQRIFAYFPSSTRAEKAIAELKQANIVPEKGYVQIDRVSQYTVANDSEYNNPINAAILNGLTPYSNNSGLDKLANPLLVAKDSESGRGAYDDNFSGKSFMVTLVTNKENVDKAVEILNGDATE